MRVVNAHVNDQGAQVVVLKTGLRNPGKVPGDLRCGGYRWKVVSAYPAESGALVAIVSGPQPPIVGMVVHAADEPLTDEEIREHLRMLPNVLRVVRSVDFHWLREALFSSFGGSEEEKAAGLDASKVCAAFEQAAEATKTVSGETLDRYADSVAGLAIASRR